MPRKTFVAGEVLAAADVNTYLMDQAVMTFAGSAARGSAIASPSEGMVSYLEDTDSVEVYDSTNWVAVGGSQTGNVIQVVSTTKTDTFSASLAANTETSVTGLSATITPSSTSSKIICLVTLNGGISLSGGSSDTSLGIFLKRGATTIVAGDSAGNRQSVSGQTSTMATLNANRVTGTVNYLDSPSTTSATTYSIDISHSSGATQTVYVNRTDGDADSSNVFRSVSTLTLMEVAG